MPNIYLRPEHANIKFPKWLPVPDTASGMASCARYRFGNGFVCPVPLREWLRVPGTASGMASRVPYCFESGFGCPKALRNALLTLKRAFRLLSKLLWEFYVTGYMYGILFFAYLSMWDYFLFTPE